MENYRFIRGIIEFSVKRGIDYIIDNPKRGLRNLVDLGKFFASGPFQEIFFDIANEILHKEDSFYYEIIENIVRNTDKDILTNFGVNLGYNSFIYGARKLRENEKRLKFKIPWTIVFDFRNKNEKTLNEEEIMNIFTSGKNVGIYCYIIFLDDNDILKDLATIIKRNSDCAVTVIVSPKIINEEVIDTLTTINNLCLLVLINDIDEAALSNTIDVLKKERLFYGGAYYYDDNNYSYIFDEEGLSEKLSNLDFNFLMMIQMPNCSKEISHFIQKLVYKTRLKTDSPLFMMDFYGDIELVGKIISEMPKETHFLSVDDMGYIGLSSLESKTGYNIRSLSFNEILSLVI